MITYETVVRVKLDGKHVGDIVEVDTPTHAGFSYVPKGHKFGVGYDVYHSIGAVKKALED